MKLVYYFISIFVFLFLCLPIKSLISSQAQTEILLIHSPYEKLREAKKVQYQLPEKFSEDELAKVLSSITTLDIIANGKYEDYLIVVEKQPLDDQLKWQYFCDLQEFYKKIKKKSSIKHFDQFIEKSIISLHLTSAYKDSLSFSTNEKNIFKKIQNFTNYYYLSFLDEGLQMFQACQSNFCNYTNEEIIDLCFLTNIIVNNSTNTNDISYPLIHYTSSTHLAFQSANEAFHQLKQKDYKEVYQNFLQKQSDRLGIKLNSPFNQLVIKLSIMFHVFEKNSMYAIADQLLELDPNTLNLVLEVFQNEDYFSGMKNFYMLLHNIYYNFEFDFPYEIRLRNAINIAMPILCELYKEKINGDTEQFHVEFSPVAAKAKVSLNNQHLTLNANSTKDSR